MNKVISAYFRKLTGRRKSRKGWPAGAPRSTAARCDCGLMTLKRAQTRGRNDKHGPACPFYLQK